MKRKRWTRRRKSSKLWRVKTMLVIEITIIKTDENEKKKEFLNYF